LFLFDLESDPLERENLVDSGSHPVEALAGLLHVFGTEAQQVSPNDQDAEDVRDRLRAIGYLR